MLRLYVPSDVFSAKSSLAFLFMPTWSICREKQAIAGKKIGILFKI